MNNKEKLFLEELSLRVGQEDYNRDSIKSRFTKFKSYMRKHFDFKCPIIIVGGTNGKGSVVQGVHEQAKIHGLKAAVWTSPHIESLVERYKYDYSDISWNKLEELINDELNDEQMKFSLFELFFVVFCRWVQSLEPDLIILEVGLGGRLDAVNVFDADVSVITSISRDHIQYLGNSYKKILTEKIQIARENKPVIVQTPLQFLHSHIKEQALLIGAKPELLSQGEQEDFQDINCRVVRKSWEHLYPNLGFIENNNEIKADIRKQRVESWQNKIHFNGAHNSDGMRQLMSQLCRQSRCSMRSIEDSGRKQCLILAFSQRPVDEVRLLLRIVRKYSSLFSSVTLTCFEHARSLEPGLSRQIASESDIVFDSDWKKYIQQILEDDQQCLVAGSYYFVGEVKSYLRSLSRYI